MSSDEAYSISLLDPDLEQLYDINSFGNDCHALLGSSSPNYRFMNTTFEELRLGDVPLLLSQYKHLVMENLELKKKIEAKSKTPNIFKGHRRANSDF